MLERDRLRHHLPRPLVETTALDGHARRGGDARATLSVAYRERKPPALRFRVHVLARDAHDELGRAPRIGPVAGQLREESFRGPLTTARIESRGRCWQRGPDAYRQAMTIPK